MAPRAIDRVLVGDRPRPHDRAERPVLDQRVPRIEGQALHVGGQRPARARLGRLRGDRQAGQGDPRRVALGPLHGRILDRGAELVHEALRFHAEGQRRRPHAGQELDRERVGTAHGRHRRRHVHRAEAQLDRVGAEAQRDRGEVGALGQAPHGGVQRALQSGQRPEEAERAVVPQHRAHHRELAPAGRHRDVHEGGRILEREGGGEDREEVLRGRGLEAGDHLPAGDAQDLDREPAHVRHAVAPRPARARGEAHEGVVAPRLGEEAVAQIARRLGHLEARVQRGERLVVERPAVEPAAAEEALRERFEARGLALRDHLAPRRRLAHARHASRDPAGRAAELASSVAGVLRRVAHPGHRLAPLVRVPELRRIPGHDPARPQRGRRGRAIEPRHPRHVVGTGRTTTADAGDSSESVRAGRSSAAGTGAECSWVAARSAGALARSRPRPGRRPPAAPALQRRVCSCVPHLIWVGTAGGCGLKYGFTRPW